MILIGGKNGTGKTTILEAIKLCLYGQKGLGTYLTTREYRDYLHSKIHRSPVMHEQPNHATIKMEFEQRILGEKEEYKVTRSWHNNGKESDQKNIDNLTVVRNGSTLARVDIEIWEDHMKDQIPPELSRLFFFDGEKISELAEGPNKDSPMVSAFERVLGLDLVTRLAADLRIYSTRTSKKHGDSTQKARIRQIEREVATLVTQIESLRQNRAQIQSRMGFLRGDIEREERELAGRRGHLAQRRQQIQKESAEIEAQTEAVAHNIMDMCTGLLPFCACEVACERLEENLEREINAQRRQAVRDLLENLRKDLPPYLESPKLWEGISIPSEKRQVLLDRVLNTLHGQLAPRPEEAGLIHKLSEQESQVLLGWIREIRHSLPQRYIVLNKRLTSLNERRRKLEAWIQQMPDDDVISPIVKRLNGANQELGQLSHESRKMDELMKSLEYQLSLKRSSLGKEQEKINTKNRDLETVKLANKVGKALADYENQIRSKKADLLASYFERCFRRLARKKDLFTTASVDPSDFSVTLKNARDQSIQDQLSAGEKQIHAISLIWALTRCSGRSLPFIIDTPLAKLDSDHRENMVKGFFSEASRQVVILSTDTELDKVFSSLLAPHTSHAYLLDYDPLSKATWIHEGYFWKEASH